ncbi:hypothetical protein [Brevundimonas sp.]|uniref:hypothetical protein n=1 Tax=Brevundimonas sp. TaxID=1871086 RepID=UPI002ED8BFAC
MASKIGGRAAAVLVLALCGPQAVFAQGPKVTLTAEWLTPACEFPARFRVTVENTGDAAFAMPSAEILGHGRPINFSATLDEGVFAFTGDRHFSSESFFRPPPAPSAPLALVDLSPGESKAFELEFDGVFDAHGGPLPTYEGRWRGEIQFYYFLPLHIAAERPGYSPPILSSAEDVSAWSNILECA